MKVLILTMGTRGDVQPFVALARALDAAGHEAVVAAPGQSAALVTANGVRHAHLDDGPMRLIGTEAARRALGGGVRAQLDGLRRMPAMYRQVLEDAWSAASAGADLVVHHPQALAGQHVAERLDVPAVVALPLPYYLPTREFPCPGVPVPRWWPAAWNRATYAAVRAATLAFRGSVDAWRERTLGLPRRRGRHDPLRRPDGGPAPVLHACSPSVLPPPADWPEPQRTTGYWFLPAAEGWTPPRRLAEFLDAGEPPVYVGFGSMAGTDPRRTGRIVIEAVRRAGVRAVLATGWGAMEADELPEGVTTIEQAPHDWLFPRVAAVCHHGGAGTTGAAVAAGRPQVVCPFVADQPFSGRHMHRLGVAPAPLPQRHLDSGSLARALRRAVDDDELRDRAEGLGRAVRAERGTDAAVAALEQLHTRFRAGRRA